MAVSAEEGRAVRCARWSEVRGGVGGDVVRGVSHWSCGAELGSAAQTSGSSACCHSARFAPGKSSGYSRWAERRFYVGRTAV